MRLPWTRTENREAETLDATEVAISALQQAAAGKTPRATELAALEIGAGLIGRAFAAATVSGSPEASRLLTRPALALAGRALALRGEAVFALADPLAPVSGHDIAGSADPASWAYRIDLAGPSRTSSRFLPADAVLHFRQNVDPSRPWKGRPAHGIAAATALTAAAAEKSAYGEAKFPISKLIPLVNPVNAGQRDQVQGAWGAELGKGGIFPMPVAGGHRDSGRISRPTVETIHPDPSSGHIALRSGAANELLAAMGVPPSLIDPAADGTSRREAYRLFAHACLEPMARLVEAEWSLKMGVPCSLSFESLFAADLAGRGRVYKQLVDGGLSSVEALSIVGLRGDDGDGA